jgi:hypothetical protein
VIPVALVKAAITNVRDVSSIVATSPAATPFAQMSVAGDSPKAF